MVKDIKSRRKRSKWKRCKDKYDPNIHGKIIPSFPDYSADKEGNIWSFKDRTPKIIKQMVKNRSYPKCTLLNDTGRYCKSTHALVAEAYLGPIPDSLEIRHLDSNKSNYRPENLAYGTRSENRIDAVKLKVQAKLTVDEAKEIYKLANLEEMLQSEIAKIFNISPRSVSAIKHKHTWAWMHEEY